MKNLDFRENLLQIKPYVPGKPIEEVKRELGISDVIKLASNENALGPSPLAMEAAARTLASSNIYPDGAAYTLRHKLAEGLKVQPENIIFGTGGDEIIFYFAHTFLKPTDNIVVPVSTFSEYTSSALIMDAEVRKVPMTDKWGADPEAMLARADGNTKAFYITNPNNPTGTLLDKKTIESFLDRMPERCVLFLDEAYFEYVDDTDYSDMNKWIAEDRRIVVLRTFSKIYGLAGLRIGYALAPADIIDIMERVRLPFNTGIVAQAAALAALDDREHVARSRKSNREGKEYLYGEFDRLGINYVPTQANFIWFDAGQDCVKVFGDMMKQGVIIRSGNIFGAPTHLRVTIGTPEENRKFVKALSAVLGRG
ncbi:MAG: histidinol-phosphate transaminase [Abditibacteriota bacterium]|nr:histidinol-phosphate transaminase [Abditibacteriota bacterium]